MCSYSDHLFFITRDPWPPRSVSVTFYDPENQFVVKLKSKDSLNRARHPWYTILSALASCSRSSPTDFDKLIQHKRQKIPWRVNLTRFRAEFHEILKCSGHLFHCWQGAFPNRFACRFTKDWIFDKELNNVE